jgi:hypothetical protein
MTHPSGQHPDEDEQREGEELSAKAKKQLLWRESKQRGRQRLKDVAKGNEPSKNAARRAGTDVVLTPEEAQAKLDREKIWSARHTAKRKEARHAAKLLARQNRLHNPEAPQAGPSRTRRDSAEPSVKRGRPSKPLDRVEPSAEAGPSGTRLSSASRRQDWRKHAKRLREEEERLGSRMVSSLLGVGSPEPEPEREQRIAEVRLKREREQLLRGQQGPGHDGGRGL